jgi:hypothetical protein
VSQRPFPTSTAFEQGQHRTFRVAKCRCGFEGKWWDKTAGGANFDLAANAFRKIGWKVTSGGKMTCPRCNAEKPAKALTPAQKRAAYCAIAGVARAAPTPPTPLLEPVVTMTVMHIAEEEPVQAEQPRQPTREDRRRIQDELDAIYDIPGQRYRASWKDEAVAAKLAMPRAWIAEERDRAYGPEANEAALEDLRRLKQLEGALQEAIERCYAAADAAFKATAEAEKLQGELSALRRDVA